MSVRAAFESAPIFPAFNIAPRGGRRLSDYGTEGVRKHPARR